MVVGVAGIITSTVMACKATLKVDVIIDEAKENIEKIASACVEHDEETYSNKDAQKDLMIVKVQGCIAFIRLYGPAFTLGVASISCILGAHNIMSKRNVALLSAYKAVEQTFSDYRKRVVEEYGDKKDHQFKYGIREEEVQVEETDANGKK